MVYNKQLSHFKNLFQNYLYSKFFYSSIISIDIRIEKFPVL